MELEQARKVLEIEAEAIRALIDRIGEEFLRAIEILDHCPGKVALTGMGKSGLVARKIASTFASTGEPSFFLHPAEAVHGDLGMLSRDDVVIAISKSGETKEIVELLPMFKRLGLKLICITGAPDSTLGKASDVVLDTSVKEEACPLNLAPTASSTAALAMGDALAITLFKKRGFTEEDFAALHPGGALGRKLLKVKDLMHTGEEMPLVGENEQVEKILLEMSEKKLGHTGVINGQGKLVGIISDGDLRRALAKNGTLSGKSALELMTKNPKLISAEALAAKALQVMESYSITALFILASDGKPEGIIHLHDILKAKVV